MTERDEALAALLARYGAHPPFARPPGFATLLRIVLEQQVSLASARTTFERLERASGVVTPEALLALGDAALKAAGFSRQKIRYARGLAQAVSSGDLDLSALERAADDEVRARLTRLSGIGGLTADSYLLMALGRPDVFPVGDLALARAVQDLTGAAQLPSKDDLAKTAERWRPYRSSAARLLWHGYVRRRT